MRTTQIGNSPLRSSCLTYGCWRVLPSQTGYRPEKFLPGISAIANARGVKRTTIALAWLLKHPSGIVPIVGTTIPERIREAVNADNARRAIKEHAKEYREERKLNRTVEKKIAKQNRKKKR